MSIQYSVEQQENTSSAKFLYGLGVSIVTLIFFLFIAWCFAMQLD